MNGRDRNATGVEVEQSEVVRVQQEKEQREDVSEGVMV